MLNTVDIQMISKVFGKSVDDLSKAITSESEVALKLPDVYDTVKTNMRGAGIEIGIKQVFKQLAIPYTDADKTEDRAKELISAHFSSKLDESSKQIKTLKDQIEKGGGSAAKLAELQLSYDKLTTTHTKVKGELEASVKTLKADAFNQKRDLLLAKSLPEDMAMDKEDMMILLRTKLHFKETDNGTIIPVDGKGAKILDDLGDTMKADKYIGDFVKEKYIDKGKFKLKDNQNPDGKSTYDQVLAQLKDEKIEPMSSEGQARLAETL